ncbi:MAG: aspartate aminotransferase family protein, partial [Myxococcales bacterium]|nr:aspartate aminotransferase family protein [Myxococcales bacterium]
MANGGPRRPRRCALPRFRPILGATRLAQEDIVSERIAIPAQGLDHARILEQLQGFRAQDADWKAGRTWALVYYAGEAHYDLIKQAHHLYFSENGLNPIAFGSLKRMETDVVSMTASMLHAPADAVGTMTSGGTESLLLAVKAYRDRARKLKPWIRKPEMVLPRTAHCAFDKAAHYFGVKARYAPVGPDFRADPAAMRKLINRNTVLLVASAPQYPQGVVDPIEDIAALAREKKLPLHIDACFGGFVLPWLEKAGVAVPLWDFRVDGVTSISADLHKYGFAAKGASTLTYRDMSYLKHQFFVSTDWPGGIYASATIPGTRPGGPIAAAWAALHAMGEDGYVRTARVAWETAARLRAGVDAIDGIRNCTTAHAPVVSYMADAADVDIYVVADRMTEKGWEVSRQQYPACVHMTVNANQAPIVEAYLADLTEAVAWCRAHPEARKTGEAAMYGMMAKVPIRAFVKQSVLKVMEAMYAPGVGGMPDLGNLGGGEGDDPLLKLVDKYGDQAMEALDKLSDARAALK